MFAERRGLITHVNLRVGRRAPHCLRASLAIRAEGSHNAYRYHLPRRCLLLEIINT